VTAAPLILADVVLGAPGWLWPGIALATVALLALLIAYVRTSSPGWLRAACGLLKTAAIVLLAICLVEPMFTGTRPRPGDNLFLVVADNSRSLQLADRGAGRSRGTIMQAELSDKSSWLTRLAQDYDVRRYTFDTTLHPVQDFSGLTLDGEASTVTAAVDSLRQRFRGQPVAGILLLTDGNATDSAMEARSISEESTPPIYPVVLASDADAVDLSVTQLAVSQTNFDAAPVTIAAEFSAQSLGQRQVVVRVLDEAGKELERRTLAAGEGQPLAQRFLIKPEKPGISFYQVQASVAGEEEIKPGRSVEATLANNRRLATVDRGGGPYRVLYVGGMPNWEFKFLRRAISADDEVQLVGLVRVAKREPKFTFLSRSGERTNPLFRGFGNTGEQTEEYDQPVLIRLGTEDKDELRGGFPKDAEDLFAYHAVVLDDIEAAFFTQDQLSLLQRFVGQRGGGLLMMGGKNSFQEGGFARSPVGEMLPVYLDRSAPLASSGGYRLKLTREGWLQPWVRVRATEEEESQRLASMPAFKSLNRIDAIKPGASVLAEVEDNSGPRPALVVQPFGRGRVGALMLGDLWRWDLRREDHAQSDLEKSWRQTVRWLVADVPQRVEVETRRTEGPGLAPQEIIVRARDKQFAPLDNASVSITVKTPDKRELTIVAESSDKTAGGYHATFSPRVAGAYRAEVSVTAADGSDVGRRETGWAVEPETEEFRSLSGNRALLEQLANDSGGEVIDMDDLDRFVSSLPNRKIPITENWTYPLWHQWTVLALAIGCLVGEWGLRRWRGLP
jgi:uncharacterized membrane protein